MTTPQVIQYLARSLRRVAELHVQAVRTPVTSWVGLKVIWRTRVAVGSRPSYHISAAEARGGNHESSVCSRAFGGTDCAGHSRQRPERSYGSRGDPAIERRASGAEDEP